ncbi:TRAP transporter large permease [Sporolactobacillus vineae]|uniref:TRAP transporter large permease n=1 Tax=Sporolactobacillus vineae TaxID=444463 RepID=UPI000287EE1D|nr:TRAP transporter large permease [Sporolactobacillus vineae]
MIGLYMVLILFALFIIRVPISFALGISSLFGLIMTGTSLDTMSQQMVSSVNYSMLAIPLFLFAGDIMAAGGISQKLVNFADLLVGHLYGGLGLVVILSCMLFSAISGSAIGDAVALGSILIPSMINRGYNRNFSASIVASGSMMGPMIPPSIPLVLFGVMTNASIGDLFLSGVIPGVMIGVFLMIYVYLYGRKFKIKEREKRASIKEILTGFKDAFLALLLPILIIGGFRLGIFTATEAGVVAVVYGFIVAVFFNKDLKLKMIPKMLLQSTKTTSSIMFLIATASVFSWVLTYNDIPQILSDAITSTFHEKWIILLIINIALLIAGTFIETVPALTIFTPLFFPIMQSIGMDPIQYGLMIVFNLTIGMITPPVGICLITTAAIAKTTLLRAVKSFLPQFAILLLVLGLITYWPDFSLFLPHMFNK